MGYSKEVYNEALGKMEKRRYFAQQELEKRKENLYELSPRAKQIEREQATLSIKVVKAVLTGANKKIEIEKLKKNNLKLQAELESILERYGFKKNYLQEWYQCDICKDKGDIDGKMCSCMRTLLKQTAYDRLNSISPLELSDFNDFSLKYYPKMLSEDSQKNAYEQMKKILEICKKYSESFSTDSKSLLFQGNPGLGKTHLSLSIAKRVIEKGFGVVYVSSSTIFKQLEKERFTGNEYLNSDTEQSMLDCDLLIIDDLGTEFSTKFITAEIFNIINSRILKSKPTIINTNLSMKALQDKYDIRTISRIIGEFSRFDFIGNDIRQIKKMSKTK